MQYLKKFVVFATLWSLCAIFSTVHANEEAQTRPKTFGLAFNHIKKDIPKKFGSALLHAQSILGIDNKQNSNCVVKSTNKKPANPIDDELAPSTPAEPQQPSALHTRLTTTVQDSNKGNGEKAPDVSEKKYCVIEISSDAGKTGSPDNM